MAVTPAGTTTVHYLYPGVYVVNSAGVPQANLAITVKDSAGATLAPRDSASPYGLVTLTSNASGFVPPVYLPSDGGPAVYSGTTILPVSNACDEGVTPGQFAGHTSRLVALETAPAPVQPAGSGGNIFRILATGSPLTYVLTSVPTRTVAPFRDYVGTLDPTSGAFGFDSAADSWNGRPYSFATSAFLPADRAWLDLFDRTTPLDQTTYVYSATAPSKPWATQPYAPAPSFVSPSIILNAGDPVPSGFTTGVVFDRPTPSAAAPTAIGESVTSGTGAASVATATTAALAAGDWIVVAHGANGATTTPSLTLTGPAGITIQRAATIGNPTSVVAIYVGQVTAAQASGITLTAATGVTGSAGDETFVKITKMSGLAGTAATVTDQTATGAGGNVSTLTLTTAAATSQANEIAFATFQFNQGNPVAATRTAVPVGWTEVGASLVSPAGDAAPRQFSFYYKVLNTATTQSVAQSTSAPTSTVGALATFKSA